MIYQTINNIREINNVLHCIESRYSRKTVICFPLEIGMLNPVKLG